MCAACTHLRGSCGCTPWPAPTSPISRLTFPTPLPVLQWSDTSFDQYILALQRWAYEQALVLVQQRRAVIEAVGRELCENRWAQS